ncbi:hypothetical protein BAE44_0004791, partial [Dichanthelium oligosanthes]
LKPHTLRKQRSVAAILMITAWNIWNERNRKNFEHKNLQAVQVFGLVKLEILQRVKVCGRPEFF